MDRSDRPRPWWWRAAAWVADLLPVSPQDEEEAARLAARGADQSAHRLQRFRIGRLGKNGRGGFR